MVEGQAHDGFVKHHHVHEILPQSNERLATLSSDLFELVDCFKDEPEANQFPHTATNHDLFTSDTYNGIDPDIRARYIRLRESISEKLMTSMNTRNSTECLADAVGDDRDVGSDHSSGLLCPSQPHN